MENDTAGFQALPSPWVGVGLTLIGPVGDLEAIDPYGDSWAIGDDRFREPLLIVRVDASRVGATKDAAGSTVLRIAALSVFELVLDLAFVAIHEFTGNAAEENTGVQSV